MSQTSPPRTDFSSDPEVVRVVAEGERLAFGHLFNPAFAVETALIDPLPHQRIAVYQHLLPQTRLRFLLADDAGAGKTIVAGLYIRLERIRRELNSDKVFDVVGRLFEGVSLREYLEQALTDEGADAVSRRIEGTLTKEQVAGLEDREKRLYGDGGDVKSQLPEQEAQLERERWRKLLPGYVRRFVVQSAPLLGLALDGDPDGFFAIKEKTPHALDPLRPTLETYEVARRQRLTLAKPADTEACVFLHPGEPFFDRLRAFACERFRDAALRGGVFVDPYATKPYLFHLALVAVVRQADPQVPPLAREELVDCRLVGLRQEAGGPVEPCPVEQLLLLRGGAGMPAEAFTLAGQAAGSRDQAGKHAASAVAAGMATERRQALRATLDERLDFVSRGFDYQDAELATARSRLTDRARAGDSRAKGEVTRIRDRQRSLADRKEAALAVLRREPKLIVPGEVTFLAHALVVPTADSEDRRRHDAEVEARAVQVAWAFEAAAGATVQDVSTPDRAVLAGLVPNPGFDLLSMWSAEGKRAIEVKGRGSEGDVELTENEWVQACNHRDRYWLYVVYDCATPNPRLLRVQDPFGKLIVKAKGSVVIGRADILRAAEQDGSSLL